MTHWQINPEEITRFLQEMVHIDSVNPGLVDGAAGETQIAAWLAQTCRDLGLDVELQETAPNRPNVIARWKGERGGKSLLLTGHTDVVSVENMQRDPFDGRIENGKLYGRGALDMKGGLASILGAVQALQSDGFKPAGDLWLGFVTDEENFSIGTDALVKKIQPDAAILTEPTNLDICIAHKGFAWATISTHGTAAHGSLHDVGVDAIAHMGRILNALETLNRDQFPQQNHPLLGRPSVHAGTIHGGTGASIYPHLCQLIVEHRLLPDETPEQVLAIWNAIIEDQKRADQSFNAAVSLDFSRPGYQIDPQAAIVQTLSDAYRTITDREPALIGMKAWLDSAILSRAGVPTVIIGPGGEGMHAAVEYVELDTVFACAEILAETTSRWIG
jgi:acetylornithine deacetylase